jgi:hypothetical protein
LKFPVYKGLSQEESVRRAKQRIADLETEPLANNNAEIVGNIHHMMQATSFSGVKSWGNLKVSPNGTTTAIDEDTSSAVIAHTNFEDPFGNGVPISSPFVSGRVAMPMYEYEGRTAWYHGYYNLAAGRPNLFWTYNPPVVAHTKLHVMSRAFRLNVPGSSSFDRDAFVYYASNAVFNVGGNTSHALWFYPTAVAEAGEVFGFLQWRYQDASNWIALVIKHSNLRIQCHVREAGTTVKLETTGSIILGQWNLVIWSFAPATNAITIELNDVGTTSTPSETLTVPYTTDSNMYLGNIPNSNQKRFEGYFGQYVAWNTILTGAHKDSFWDTGTIL